MVLVTGATGFLGSHLLLQLTSTGDRIRALYREHSHITRTERLFRYFNKESQLAAIEWYCADITDIPQLEPAFDSVTHVYHCAAMVSFDPRDESQLRKTNIEGTANIVNISIARGISKVCFVSSIASLGDQPPHEDFITEETEWNPEAYHSDYAISKYGAEMEIWRGLQEGLQAVIVNPGVIIGPWPEKSGSMEIFHRIKKGLKWYTEGYAGFVAVEDVVVLMQSLMNSNVSGERFVVVAENIRFNRLVSTIADCLGVKKPQRKASLHMTNLAYKADWLWAFITSSPRRLPKAIALSLHSDEKYSSEKIIALTGHRFLPVQDAIAGVCRFLTVRE